MIRFTTHQGLSNLSDGKLGNRIKRPRIMSVIQSTSTSTYLAAHIKEQARSMPIDLRNEDDKDPLLQSAKTVLVSLSHDAKQALLKDAMGPGSLSQAPTFKAETP